MDYELFIIANFNTHLFHCLESAEVTSSLVTLSEREVEPICLHFIHTLRMH